MCWIFPGDIIQKLPSFYYIFKTDFKTEGSSNYAFTLVLRNKDFELRDKIEKTLREHNIEFRRGLSGGGNQLHPLHFASSAGYRLCTDDLEPCLMDI